MLHKAISEDNKLKYNLDKKRLQIQAKNFDCSQDSKLMTALKRLFTGYWDLEIPHVLTDMQIFFNVVNCIAGHCAV